MPRFSRVAPFLLISLATALSACSSTTPAFQDDQLLSNAPSPFSRGFNYASTDACEASRRALLSQGYMTTMTRNDTVDATKNFQPTIDQHIVVEVHVVCTPADATNTSMVYVNAVQNGYALKKSATSASVGLSILGSVSLPIHSNSDEMVKVSSETIQSDAFYTRFFGLVGRYLNTVARSEPVPGAGNIKSTPLPLDLELAPAMVNTAAPGASTAPAGAAAAAAAAATGVAVMHTTVASPSSAVPVHGTQAAAPVAAASGVHAVFPASPASEATLLTPVLPAPASAAAANAASAPVVGANHAAQPGTGAVPASGASATQAAAPVSGASATQAAAPASGATAGQAPAQPAAAPAAMAAAPASATTHTSTAASSPMPASGAQSVIAASSSGTANAPASNPAPAATTAP